MTRIDDYCEEEIDLPRIVHNPITGFHALEIKPLRGIMHNAVDLRIIVGVFESDVLDGDKEKQVVIGRNVGCLQTLVGQQGGSIATSHGYQQLRDLLYPAIKDSIY